MQKFSSSDAASAASEVATVASDLAMLDPLSLEVALAGYESV